MSAQDSSLHTPAVETPLEAHLETAPDIQRPIQDGDLAPRASDFPEHHLAESPPTFDSNDLASSALGPRGTTSIGRGDPNYDSDASMGGDPRHGFNNPHDRWRASADLNSYPVSRAQATPSPPSAIPNESVMWRYVDHKGQVQGASPSSPPLSFYSA